MKMKGLGKISGEMFWCDWLRSRRQPLGHLDAAPPTVTAGQQPALELLEAGAAEVWRGPQLTEATYHYGVVLVVPVGSSSQPQRLHLRQQPPLDARAARRPGIWPPLLRSTPYSGWAPLTLRTHPRYSPR